MALYTAPITHRPERDGSTLDSPHVTYFLAVEYASDAWRAMLDKSCGELLPATDLGVVDVSGQFTKEMFVGEATAEVELAHVGTSSIGFRVTIYQGGQQCAVITTVLAQLADGRTRSRPLSHEQRTALERFTQM